jgi:beta-N-acetylhexosaminidase
VPTSPASAPGPELQDLIGQKLVVRMDGSSPSASLLARARRGQIGGVILHRFNFSSAAHLRSITRKLQGAAAAGGRPPLLIAVDQEGGPVTTIPWAPPTLSPPQIGASGWAATARAQGRRTGDALRALGVNADLAPVADVPSSATSLMWPRRWSSSAGETSRLATAFAAGLADRHVLATVKHFPGLGPATRNTDKEVVRIAASRARLTPGLRPFRAAVVARVPLVMLSNAVYGAYDRRNGAGWSHAIGTTLLRDELGFRGATITDSLDGAAHARGVPADVLAVRAGAAGTDLILITGSEAASLSVYTSLMRAALDGRVDRARLTASYARILMLKGRYGASARATTGASSSSRPKIASIRRLSSRWVSRFTPR